MELLGTSFSSFQIFLYFTCGILIGMSKTGLSGAGLLVVPIMASLFGGKASTGILLPILIMADVFAVYYYHRHAQWRYIFIALPWAVAGVILGTLFGASVNDDLFKNILAIIILTSIGLMLWLDFRSKQPTIPDTWWFGALLGLIGGFATMVGNASGPIMALYLLSMHLQKNSYIGTAAWFFFIINLIKVPFHVLAWHTITPETLQINLIVLPAIGLGVFAGIKLIKLFPEKAYRYFIVFTTCLAAVFLF